MSACDTRIVAATAEKATNIITMPEMPFAAVADTKSFTLGVLTTIFFFGLMADEYTVLKYLAVVVAILCYLWVAQVEQVTEERNVDEHTTPSIAIIGCGASIRCAVIIHHTLAIFTSIASFQHLDSISGAEVLYRPPFRSAQHWLNTTHPDPDGKEISELAYSICNRKGNGSADLPPLTLPQLALYDCASTDGLLVVLFVKVLVAYVTQLPIEHVDRD